MKNKFSRVLIASDLSEMDDRLLSTVQQLSKQAKIEKVYLFHTIPNMLVPTNTDLEFHKMFTTGYPIDEKVKDVLVGKSLKYFEGADFEVAVEVVEGQVYKKMLEMIKLKEIDLLVVGNKEQSEGSGITARRIARKVSCHVLFVPTSPPEKTNNILVPIDFSPHSTKALKTALDLRAEGVGVTALNVVRILQTDYYYGLAINSDFRNSLQEAAWEAFRDFQINGGLSEANFEKEVVVNNYNNVASQIKDYVEKNEFDMVVMGAKGHSVFENFLIGSVTENFLISFNKTPVLIIR